jgi:hypothetical protein
MLPESPLTLTLAADNCFRPLTPDRVKCGIKLGTDPEVPFGRILWREVPSRGSTER